MALKPHGIDVVLYEQTASEPDELNHTTVIETATTVQNVVVCPSSENEITDTLNLYGKRSVYTLCIPKGDMHSWENCRVSFFGSDWRVIGDVVEFINDLVPLSWNKKARVESIVTESQS